nr:hypothetical protein ANMEGGLA_00177 [Acinetobacter nosocomialis]
MKIRVFILNQYLLAFTLCSITALSGCQLVSLKQQTLHTTLANERNSILTQNKLSEASLNVIYMSNKDVKTCIQAPKECIDTLKKIPQLQDEQLLSTASELYLSKAIALSESYECESNKLIKAKTEEGQKHLKCLDEQLDALDFLHKSFFNQFNSLSFTQSKLYMPASKLNRRFNRLRRFLYTQDKILKHFILPNTCST